MGKISDELNSSRCTPKSGTKRKELEVDCQKCGLDALCKLLGYDEGEVNLPEGTLLRSQSISRGETIFRTGDPFRSFFAVKSGSFKSLTLPQQGQEKVVGFHFPGEIVGTDGIAGNTYTCTARALEASRVCELRLEKLQYVACSGTDLKDGIISILGDEITFSHELKVSLIHQNSEQRMAAFLLNVSSRKSERGMSGEEFRLSMSRSDIASYLGLASETVSRILMKIQKLGMIDIRNKSVRILDLEALQALANAG
ncbi:MAG: helix-turn-helix domain-containing protein [Gammaproteobacteria bacterium]|jgi:CRP/FNR family transcriptional regulator, anaerobic regulatory protein